MKRVQDRQQKEGYSLIPNRVLHLVSGDALRVWLTLWIKPDNFRATRASIQSECNISESTVKRILRDLLSANLISVTRSTGSKGIYNLYQAVYLADEARTSKTSGNAD